MVDVNRLHQYLKEVAPVETAGAELNAARFGENLEGAANALSAPAKTRNNPQR